MGVEPTPSAWEADVLPIYYICMIPLFYGISVINGFRAVRISFSSSLVSKIRNSNVLDKSILKIPITDFASTTYLPEAKSKFPWNCAIMLTKSFTPSMVSSLIIMLFIRATSFFLFSMTLAIILSKNQFVQYKFEFRQFLQNFLLVSRNLMSE